MQSLKKTKICTVFVVGLVMYSNITWSQNHQWEVYSGVLISDLWNVPSVRSFKNYPPLLTYNFGVSYLINEEKNYSFKVGVSYMSYGKYLNKDHVFDFDTTFVLPDGTLIEFPATITSYSKNYFIELPLTTEYKWQKGRFSPFIRLDIVPQIYVNRKYVQESDRSSLNFSNTERLSNIRSYNLALGTGLGTYYKLSEKLSLIAHAFTRVQTLSNQDGTSKYYIYAVGANLGLAFDLK